MERLTRCLVWLGVFAFAGACSGDPTNSSRTPTDIVANPEVVFVVQGDSQTVDLTIVDEQGQLLPAEFAITTQPSAAATVTPDPTFLQVIAGKPIGTTARYFVKGIELGATSFVVSGSGLEKTVRIEVVPGNLAATFSTITPAFTDTVTVTAPAGTSFSQTSAISIPPVLGGQGATDLIVTDRAADGSSFRFIVSPNRSGAATITGVKVAANPALTFTLQTTETITSPVIASVAGTFTNSTPPQGTAITYTLPAGIKIRPDSAATRVRVQGNLVAPANVTIAADSGSLTFVAPPSSDSVLTLTGIVAAQRPEYPMTLSSTTKVTTPVIDTLDVTFSNAAPEIGEAVTLTAPAGFTFTTAAVAPATNSGVAFGTRTAIISARTATTITFVPLPGSTGVATITRVIPTAASMFSLTLPTDDAVAVDDIVPLRFTDDPARAPAIPAPTANGQSIDLFEAGAYNYHAPLFGGAFGTFNSRLYRVTVPAAVTSLTVTLSWPTGEDMGVYWFEDDGVGEPAEGVPADGALPCCNPETSTSLLQPRTYLLAVVNFDTTNPPFFKLTLTAP